MTKFKETFERLMAAISFAEAGEHETALDIMHDKKEKRSGKTKDIRIRSRKEKRQDMQV